MKSRKRRKKEEEKEEEDEQEEEDAGEKSRKRRNKEEEKEEVNVDALTHRFNQQYDCRCCWCLFTRPPPSSSATA